MATDSENLQTALSAIYAELAAGPLKPDYSIDGQSVSWTQYRESLLRQAQQIQAQMSTADGPWEIQTEYDT